MIDSGRYEKFGILYLDLDNFKDVNDTFGHDIGDKVLRAMATCLQNCDIPEGSLYNIGSDEFAIVMTKVPPSRDETRVQAILQAIEQPICIDGSVFHITASMGVVCYPGHGRTYEALLKNADAAMYRAKENGRGMYVFFDETIGNAVQEHTRLQNSLREALAHNEFLLYYQPQICTDTNTLYGFEALLRWKRPGVGVVAPAGLHPRGGGEPLDCAHRPMGAGERVPLHPAHQRGVRRALPGGGECVHHPTAARRLRRICAAHATGDGGGTKPAGAGNYRILPAGGDGAGHRQAAPAQRGGCAYRSGTILALGIRPFGT